MKKHIRNLIFFITGWIEVIIGLVTFVGCTAVQVWGFYGFSSKSNSIYIFVIVTALISFILGVGLLCEREWARKVLVFFAGYIVITKVLIYFGLMSVENSIITMVPVWQKDIVSFIYHMALVILLSSSGEKGK